MWNCLKNVFIFLLLVLFSEGANADFTITLKCLLCKQPINPSIGAVLKVYCKRKCKKIEYNWYISPGVNNVKRDFDAEDITLASKNSILIIKKDVMLPNEIYNVSVIANKTTSEWKEEYIVLETKKCTLKYPCTDEEDEPIAPDYMELEDDTTETTTITPFVETTTKKTSTQITTKKTSVETTMKTTVIEITKRTETEEEQTEITVTTKKASKEPEQTETTITTPTSEKEPSVEPKEPEQIETTMTTSTSKKEPSVEPKEPEQTETTVTTLEEYDESFDEAMIILEDINEEVDMLKTLGADDAEVVGALQKELLAKLNEIPLHDPETILQTAETANNVLSVGDTTSNLEMAKSFAQLKEKLVDAELQRVQESDNPEELSDEIKKLSSTILNKVSIGTSGNKSELTNHRQEEIKEAIISNAVPPAMEEDYPIYDDFDIAYISKYKHVEKATYSTVNLVNKLGKANALTMKNTETQNEIKTSDVCVLNIVDEPLNLANKSFEVCAATIFISETLAKELQHNMEKSFITFSVLKKNPFWWNKRNISTDVVSLEITNNAGLVTRLDNSIFFSLNLNKSQSQLVGGSNKILTNETDNMDDMAINVHQLFIKRYITTFVIQFPNLQNGDKIQVVVSKDHRPSIEDFKNAIIVPLEDREKEKTTIITHLTVYAGSYCYVGVLPTKDTLLKSGVEVNNYREYNYDVKFSSISCNMWNEKKGAWDKKYCQVEKETTTDRVHCSCSHLSSFSGSIQNVESSLNEILFIPVQLHPLYNFLILYTVFTVLILYIFGVLYAIWKDRKRSQSKKVQFLMDNNLNDDYEYLIAIYTGSISGSGTTSNIGIKLYGDLGESKSHILRGNKEPILQRSSENWFLLLTSSKLGALKQIDLWIDGYGMRSSWYCHKIVVNSGREKWIFEINSWLSVLNNQTYYTATSPVKRDCLIPASKKELAIQALKRNHLWFSFFRRPSQPTFTYLERVNVMLCIIMTTMFITILLYGVPSIEYYSQLDIGRYSYDINDIGVALGSAIITFFVTFMLIYLFINSEPLTPNSTTSHFSYTKSRTWRYVAWYCLITIVVLSAIFMLIFGLWMGYYASLLWLTSVIVSLLISVILFESLRATIPVFCSKNMPGTSVSDELDISDTIIQKEILKKYGENSMRPFFNKLYQRLTESEVKVKRETELLRIDLRHLITDIIMFLIYLMILLCVVLINKDRKCLFMILTHNEGNAFADLYKYLIMFQLSVKSFELDYLEKKMRRTLFVRTDRRLVELAEAMKSMILGGKLLRYLRETFIPAVFSSKWYGDWATDEQGLTVDFNTKLLGIPRIRQIRIQNDSCSISSRMQFVVRHCNAEYRSGIQQTLNFGPRWKQRKSQGIDMRSNSIWIYKDGGVSQSTFVLGELAIYPSGGYIVNLGRTRQNSKLILQYLEYTDWIDELTRALFIEVCFYNTNQNLFNILTLIVEKSATGRYITNYSIRTSKLLFMYHELEVGTFITFVLFIIMILIFSWKKISLLRKSYISQFFSDRWNVIDVLIILLAFTFLLVYFCRSIAVSALLKTLEDSAHNEFVSFYSAVYWDDCTTILATLLVAISTIRVWKLLRFGRMFKICEITLSLASKALMAMTFMIFLLLSSFSAMGYIIFGPYSKDFRSVFQTFLSLILLAFGMHEEFDYDTLLSAYAYIGYIYYFCYMIILLIIINIFVTIIVVAYEAAIEFYEENDNEKTITYNLFNFLKDEVGYYTSKTNGREDWFRIAGGEDVPVKEDFEIKQKPGVFRNSVKISKKKLATMSDITLKCLKMLRQRFDSKHMTITSKNNLIAVVLKALLENSEEGIDENEREYFCIPENKRTKYCSKDRLNDMITIVEYLLRIDKKSTQETASISYGQQIEKLENIVHTLRSIIEDIEQISNSVPKNREFVDVSIQVTFEDVGLELVSSKEMSDSMIHTERRISRNIEQVPRSVTNARTYVNVSTQITFEDLGLELIESSDSDSTHDNDSI